MATTSPGEPELLLPGETARDAIARLDRTLPAPRYAQLLETEAGQRLLRDAALAAQAGRRRAVVLEEKGYPPASSHTESMLMQGYSGMRGRS